MNVTSHLSHRRERAPETPCYSFRQWTDGGLGDKVACVRQAHSSSSVVDEQHNMFGADTFRTPPHPDHVVFLQQPAMDE